MDDGEAERLALKAILDAKRKFPKRGRRTMNKVPRELKRTRPKRRLPNFPIYEVADGAVMPPKCQAYRILHKFGGARELAAAIRRHLPASQWRANSTIYKWTYSVDRDGTGGLIPTCAVEDVKTIARLEGIFLSDEDWAPGVR